VRTGRPRNNRIRLALLERLPSESVGDILRTGSFTRAQLSHYLRELQRAGYIEPNVYLSHLDTDGPGAKRYSVTGSGRHYRLRLARTESRQPISVETTDVKSSAGPARVVNRPAPRTGPTKSSQRYVGVHNLSYRMVIEAPFTRPFHWGREYLMGNGSWVKRHSAFGRGVHLEESGGNRWDKAGAAGHILSVKFRVPGPDPAENERTADRLAAKVRHILEQEYGCTLSDPARSVPPKHSVTGDPIAEAIRATGVAVHGPLGVDDTPEPATLEFDAADRVERYVKGIEALGTLDEKVGRLAGDLAELRRAAEGLVEAGAAQTAVLREILARLPKPPVQGPEPPARPSTGEGYG
jgi:hypothetical protein